MVQHPCPSCGSELIRLKNKDKKKYYWMCEHIKEGCKTFMDDKDGKPVPKVKAKIADEKCPKCGSEIQLKNGEKGKFWACTNYPDCKATFTNEKGMPLFLKTTKKRCPKCDSELRQMKGKNVCSGDVLTIQNVRKYLRIKMANQRLNKIRRK